MVRRTTGTFKFGIEEELFLASARTRAAPRGSLAPFHAAVSARLKGAERELQENQIEISTPPLDDFGEARARLGALRAGLAEIGRDHGLKVFAAGTHPFAIWHEQQQTEKTRYKHMIETLQLVGRRSIVSGLHVHVEVPQPKARIDLLNRLMPFLPVLLALSTSSPFWEKRRTGLSGYRLAAYAELPRTGLPQLFADDDDYERYVRGMTRSGAVEDASHFWWHIRPSAHYPTLELRVADSCTRLDDTLAIAALYRCLVRLVARRRDINAEITGATRGFVGENLWRVERNGVRAELIDGEKERIVPLAKVVEGILDLVAEDAEALGCEAELTRVPEIVRDGSSADHQIAVYEQALKEAASERVALSRVVDWLARETEGRVAVESPVRNRADSQAA